MRFLRKIGDFLTSPIGPGVLLISATILAIIVDNSCLSGAYDALFNAKFTVSFGGVGLSKPLLLWVNDGLMAIFFLSVGLEIKREIRFGNLSTFSSAILPAFAALGGMVVPALIYVGYNFGDAYALKGWAIPAATDIAFALGLLALFATRAPTSLKAFLLALAVFDDMGAIIIIAIFFTENLSLVALSIAVLSLALLGAMNWVGIRRLDVYCLVGLVLWAAVLKTGVHATLAGVVLAMAIPLGSHGKYEPAIRLEHSLHAWVIFFILPIFAFANAGINLSGFTTEQFFSGIALGTALGLVVGKPVGIMLLVWIALKMGVSKLPEGSNWTQVLGVSFLAGVGFTMSLFIGTLAFDSFDAAQSVRIGVILGSVVSAFAGLVLLAISLPKAQNAVGVEA
ncbi:MAG: Na+/H+ antiporter NhaA [Alphaproteobacteria bacterium]